MNDTDLKSESGLRPVEQQGDADNPRPLLDIKPRLESLENLPPLPEITRRILELSAKRDAQVKELVEVVELDPSLAAQVLRYASSPFFNYRGKIDSVHTAVIRVLGYHTVMHLALGISTAGPFKIPRNVPLGLHAYWRQAVFSAALGQTLSGAMPDELRPPAGLAYLAGLLHNFGHLLLGHLFKKEFLILNKFITQDPERPVLEIEREVLGTDHGQIGAWLLQKWDLPEEIVVAAREHHNEHYYGSHAVYPQLIMLVDRLLKRQGIGDAASTELPESILHSLDLGDYQTTMISNRVLEGCEGLETMAQRLAS